MSSISIHTPQGIILLENVRTYDLSDIVLAPVTIISIMMKSFHVNTLSKLIQILHQNKLIVSDQQLLTNPKFYPLVDCALLNYYVNQYINLNPLDSYILGDDRLETIRNLLALQDSQMVDSILERCSDMPLDYYTLGEIVSHTTIDDLPSIGISDELDKQSLLRSFIPVSKLKEWIIDHDTDKIDLYLKNNNPGTREELRLHVVDILRFVSQHGNLPVVNKILTDPSLEGVIHKNIDDGKTFYSSFTHGYGNTPPIIYNYPILDDALQKSSRHGHLDVVNSLLDAGANPGVKEGLAYRLANRYNHTEISRVLSYWLMKNNIYLNFSGDFDGDT